MNPIKLWELAKAAFAAWREDEAPSMGAALAYYTIFSIAPLPLSLIAVAGAFFGADAARGQIVAELGGLMGCTDVGFACRGWRGCQKWRHGCAVILSPTAPRCRLSARSNDATG